MDVQKKSKICATLLMIFFIMLFLEPIMFGTCFLLMVLFIAMAIGIFSSYCRAEDAVYAGISRDGNTSYRFTVSGIGATTEECADY